MKNSRFRTIIINSLVLVMMCGLPWTDARSQHLDDQYWKTYPFPENEPIPQGYLENMVDYNGTLVAMTNTSTYWTTVDTMAIVFWIDSVWVPLDTTTGIIRQLIVWGNKLIVIGAFTPWGQVDTVSVATFDGATWEYLVPYDSGNSFTNGLVYNGDLVVGGTFETVGVDSIQNIARWDGAAWYSLDAGAEHSIIQMCELDGDLIALQQGNVVSRWDGMAWFQVGDQVFSVDSGAGSGEISTIAAGGGKLIAGGLRRTYYYCSEWGCGWETEGVLFYYDGLDWQGVAGYFGFGVDRLQTVDSLLYVSFGPNWSDPGSTWHVFADTTLAQFPGSLSDITRGIYGCEAAYGTPGEKLVKYDGEVLLNFGMRLTRLEWDTSGDEPRPSWFPVRSYLKMLGSVLTAESFQGDLYIGGDFLLLNGSDIWIRGLAKWDGIDWQPVVSDLVYSDECEAAIEEMTVFDGRLIVSGQFDSINGVAASNLAAWDGTSWYSMGGSTLQYFTLNGFSEFNGDLIAYGRGPGPVWSWDGSAWTEIDQNWAGDFYLYEVRSASVWQDELFMVGSAYIECCNYPCIVSWDGSDWARLPTDTVIYNQYYGSFWSSEAWDDELVVGGRFSYLQGSMDTVQTNNIGSLDTFSIGGFTLYEPIAWESPFDTLLAATITHLTPYNGELYAISSKGVFRFNGDRWTGLGSGLVVSGSYGINDIIEHNGELFFVGALYEAGSQPARYVASWNKIGCCEDVTGNVDNDPSDIVDMGDLTALIDYLFLTYTEPSCLDEANTDGEGPVDMGDLTRLIDYLFISYQPTAICQ